MHILEDLSPISQDVLCALKSSVKRCSPINSLRTTALPFHDSRHFLPTRCIRSFLCSIPCGNYPSSAWQPTHDHGIFDISGCGHLPMCILVSLSADGIRYFSFSTLQCDCNITRATARTENMTLIFHNSLSCDH